MAAVAVMLALGWGAPPALGQSPPPSDASGPGDHQPAQTTPPGDDRTTASGPSVGYTVDLHIIGEGDEKTPGSLTNRLEAASSLKTLVKDPPATAMGLRRRLQSDREAMTHLLRSEGYFDARVDGTITEGETAEVSVSVTPGPRYHVSGTRVVYASATTTAGSLPKTLDHVGLSAGAPAQADAVITAQTRLVTTLRREGRPFAKVRTRQVAVNGARHAMAVRLLVDAGPPAVFGDTRIDGLDRLERGYLVALIPWHEGDTFDQGLLDQYRTKLLATRLFTAVSVAPAEAPDTEGRLTVQVTLTEAPRRSVGAGLRFSTEDGPGARLSWEHRNLLGRAEKLRANIDLGLYEQSAGLLFDKPQFLHPDQTLHVTSALTASDQAAYEGLSLETAAALDRRLSDHWRVSAGTLLELADLKDANETSQSVLVGFPLGATRDTTDSPLDPTEGTRLGLTLTPFTGRMDDRAVSFGVMDATASAYWAPLDDDWLILASRTRVASLVGADTQDVPATRRLYAGGGGSVRGYGHQMIGPLDDDDDPTGGRSAVELGLEARIKVTDSIGVVPFVEAGAVTESPWPDFEDPIQYAAGLGGRYYTDFGPLRVDIGVPLNPRDADDFVQIYISLGQAF